MVIEPSKTVTYGKENGDFTGRNEDFHVGSRFDLGKNPPRIREERGLGPSERYNHKNEGK